MRIYTMKLIVVFVGLIIISFSSYADKLEAVSDPWCPYVCASEEAGGKQGYFVDVLKVAMKRHNIEAVFNITPCTRALKETKEGKKHALVGVNTEGKPEFMFSTPLGKTQSCFFVLGDKAWTYKNAASLAGVRFGSVQEYQYGDVMMKYIEKNKDKSELIQVLPTTTNLDQNIKKVLNKRIDTFVDDRAVVEWYLVKNNLKGKLKVAGCIQERELVIAFPKVTKKRSERYLKILNDEVRRMTASGELEEIKGKYR